MGILILIFANYLPMMGKYEQKERYDDIDSVYHTYLIKNMLEYTNTSTLSRPTNSNNYVGIDCNIYNNTEYLDYCQNLFSSTGVYSIILTTYDIKSFKSHISTNLNNGLSDYILSLANYNTEKSNPQNYTYRIIVQFKHVINDESSSDNVNNKENNNVYYSYSTIGVDLG